LQKETPCYYVAISVDSVVSFFFDQTTTASANEGSSNNNMKFNHGDRGNGHGLTRSLRGHPSFFFVNIRGFF